MKVIYEKSAGKAFKATYSQKLEEFLEWNDSCSSPEGDIKFDEAKVVSGLHTSYCPDDDNPNPRATIRLSNEKLRGGGTWHVLHWRPDGPSKIFEANAAEHARLKRLERKRNVKTRQSAKRTMQTRSMGDI
ncbi:hypothetical protein V8E54_007777 [Elaphomyces granulatus]